MDKYQHLFAICSDPDILVSQAHTDIGWFLTFRRAFGHEELNLWQLLQEEVHEFWPAVGHDRVSWALEPSNKFSTNSLYRKLCNGEQASFSADIWDALSPEN